jgi:hypothetical protein
MSPLAIWTCIPLTAPSRFQAASSYSLQLLLAVLAFLLFWRFPQLFVLPE